MKFSMDQELTEFFEHRCKKHLLFTTLERQEAIKRLGRENTKYCLAISKQLLVERMLPLEKKLGYIEEEIKTFLHKDVQHDDRSRICRPS